MTDRDQFSDIPEVELCHCSVPQERHQRITSLVPLLWKSEPTPVCRWEIIPLELATYQAPLDVTEGTQGSFTPGEDYLPAYIFSTDPVLGGDAFKGVRLESNSSYLLPVDKKAVVQLLNNIGLLPSLFGELDDLEIVTCGGNLLSLYSSFYTGVDRVHRHVTMASLEVFDVDHLAWGAVVGKMCQGSHNSLVFVLPRTTVTVKNYVTAVCQMVDNKLP